MALTIVIDARWGIPVLLILAMLTLWVAYLGVRSIKQLIGIIKDEKKLKEEKEDERKKR